MRFFDCQKNDCQGSFPFMAFDSGDAEVALSNARRRVDPVFAAQERAKDLAQMTDDFEEVGQSTFGKFNDQIKNIKLP